MRGLPWRSSARDVVDFFSSVRVLLLFFCPSPSTSAREYWSQFSDFVGVCIQQVKVDESEVHLVRRNDGRLTGDGFVTFATEADAAKGMLWIGEANAVWC